MDYNARVITPRTLRYPLPVANEQQQQQQQEQQQEQQQGGAEQQEGVEEAGPVDLLNNEQEDYEAEIDEGVEYGDEEYGEELDLEYANHHQAYLPGHIQQAPAAVAEAIIRQQQLQLQQQQQQQQQQEVEEEQEEEPEEEPEEEEEQQQQQQQQQQQAPYNHRRNRHIA